MEGGKKSVFSRISDWLWEAHMLDYSQQILDQVEQELCTVCQKRGKCIGAVPMWGDVFPCRKSGERYWELVAEKEELDGDEH